MIVMTANNSGSLVRRWYSDFPGQIGHLYAPNGKCGTCDEFPYALDNGRYCLLQGKEWDESSWLRLLDWAAAKEKKPRWAVVPDVPCDRSGTLRDWDRFVLRVEKHGFLPAMACQDGMTPTDVPSGVVAFIGGSLHWKIRNVEAFTKDCSRVHVGRVNRLKWLWKCHKAGVESVDGTGWLRGDPLQRKRLEYYLKLSSIGMIDPQVSMFNS